jgi:hypothetical protein
VSLRGAVSIARRLQDPLAELVKIDPQSIGVGQYQHDLGEHKLSRALDAVVEDCVNAVGVDVNTASTRLLSRVSLTLWSVVPARVDRMRAGRADQRLDQDAVQSDVSDFPEKVDTNRHSCVAGGRLWAICPE